MRNGHISPTPSTLAAPLRWSWRDWAIVGAAVTTTYIYIGYVYPYILTPQDEGAFVYEAKRVLDGDVMYRDFFDLTGPVAQHLLAVWYLVFGTTMEATRQHTGWAHAIAAGCGYAVCRRLGVRRSIAGACALTGLALFFPAFDMASPHWTATLFTMILFVHVMRAPLLTRWPTAAAGFLTALVGLTRQPAGVAITAAVVLVLGYDAWSARHDGGWRTMARVTTCYGAGLVVTLALVLGALVLAAGFWPVFDALVLTPLGPYRQMQFVSEGRWLLLAISWELLWLLIITASPMFILNVMPLLIPLSAAHLLRRLVAGGDLAVLRPAFVAVTFSAFAMISMLYQPNFFHFAIVGPVWIVLYAEVLEGVVQRLARARSARVAEPLVVAVVLTLLALRVAHDLPERWSRVAQSDHSSFGRVDFRVMGEGDDVASVRQILHAAGAKTIFVYPDAAAVYLMTDTKNPTRFQMLYPAYNTVAQYEETRSALERERVPFVVRNFSIWGRKDQDRLLPYLLQHYEPVRLPRKPGAFPSLSLMRRRPDGASPAPPASKPSL